MNDIKLFYPFYNSLKLWISYRQKKLNSSLFFITLFFIDICVVVLLCQYRDFMMKIGLLRFKNRFLRANLVANKSVFLQTLVFAVNTLIKPGCKQVGFSANPLFSL